MLTGELVDHVADRERLCPGRCYQTGSPTPHTSPGHTAGCVRGVGTGKHRRLGALRGKTRTPCWGHRRRTTSRPQVKAGWSGFYPSAARVPASVLTSEGDEPTAQSGVFIHARLLVAFAGVVVRRFGYLDDAAGKARGITHR